MCLICESRALIFLSLSETSVLFMFMMLNSSPELDPCGGQWNEQILALAVLLYDCSDCRRTEQEALITSCVCPAWLQLTDHEWRSLRDSNTLVLAPASLHLSPSAVSFFIALSMNTEHHIVSSGTVKVHLSKRDDRDVNRQKFRRTHWVELTSHSFNEILGEKSWTLTDK